MKRKVNVWDHAGKIVEAMKPGILVTTKADGQVNTMTIGWGTLGIQWGKPIFILFVRESRYTKQMLEKNGEFTINAPVGAVDKNILSYCGTKSGRDVDKFQAFSATKRSHNGLLYVTDSTNAMFSCKVLEKVNLGSHMMFIGEVTESKVLGKDASCTYAHYHKAIKPKF